MEAKLRSGCLNDVLVKKISVYNDSRIAIIDELQSLNIEQAVKVEAYIILLCVKGKGSLYINGESRMIHVNDLFICHPNIILENSMISIDFECRCICLSSEYMKQLLLIAGESWDLKMFIEKIPILSLNVEEAELFCQYYSLLRSKMLGTPCKHQKELIDSLIQAFLYEFHDALERFIKLKPPTFTSGENLFKEFISLLSSSYPKERMIGFYANQLYVTPKYLSAVCKEVSGQTASELITQYMVKDILYLLRNSQKSIKEIANELNFPNLSFFGKYVKQHLGMSPKQYRESSYG